MLKGFLFGVSFCVFVYWFTKRSMCGPHNTEHVCRCKDCGYVFNDGVSEMRKR